MRTILCWESYSSNQTSILPRSWTSQTSKKLSENKPFSFFTQIYVHFTTILTTYRVRWQHSSNLNIKIFHNSIEYFLWNSSDFFSDDVASCLWVVFTNSVFQIPPQKIVMRVEILGIRWPQVIGLSQNESVPWEAMPEVFKFSIQEMRWRHVSQTEHLNTSGITCHGTDSFRIKPMTRGHTNPTISTRLTVFWGRIWKTVCENNPRTREDIIRREIRWIPARNAQ